MVLTNTDAAVDKIIDSSRVKGKQYENDNNEK